MAQALVDLAGELRVLAASAGCFLQFHGEENKALLLSPVEGSGIKIERGLTAGGDFVACHLKNKLYGLNMLAEFLFRPGVLVWSGKFTNKVIRASRKFLSAPALISQDLKEVFGRLQEIAGWHRCQSGLQGFQQIVSAYILFYVAHVASFLVLIVWTAGHTPACSAGHCAGRSLSLILCTIFFAKSLKSRRASFAAAAWLPMAPSAVVR